jgi:hypothetical protein
VYINIKLKNNSKLSEILLAVCCLTSSSCGFAQVISPNGYSGLGLVPDATTLKAGEATLSFDPTVPGALITRGYSTVVGFGLFNDFEITGRLATNDQKCNMFNLGECPANTYRDFSASMKWSLPIDWLKKNNSAIALGVTDYGGAATLFRSYYVVGTKTFGQIDLSLGQAKSKVSSSMLDGALASVTWRPSNWANLSVQNVGKNLSAHAQLKTQILPNGTNAWLTLNSRLSNEPVMDKKWVGYGVSMPLDRTQTRESFARSVETTEKIKIKELEKLSPSQLSIELEKKGFYNNKIGKKINGQLVVEVENTAYIWNILDAAGVAMGVIAAAYTEESKEQEFELIVTTRGIRQLKVIGEAKCVGLWLSKGDVCSKMAVQSMSQRASSTEFFPANLTQSLNDLDEPVSLSSGGTWQFRPEIIISPSVVSAIGTEYGSFDFDLGANINTVLPLWAGATLETNRLEPLNIGTKQLELGGAFYDSRLKPVTSRKMFHQLINLSAINTQARYSSGTAYSVWDGQQIETSTQSPSGRIKVGYTTGSFKNNSIPSNNERNYNLLNLRLVNNDLQTAVTEVTHGKFWAGDTGFNINQRFWYGDTTVNVYFRRSRMGANQPLVSFAGLQLAFPFTPRENKSFQHIGIRGASLWAYSLETKVLEKDNIITRGYGEVPRVGESLVTTFNRDRNGVRYFDTNISRMRNAYLALGNN